MINDEYAGALKDAVAALEALRRERHALDLKIAKLEQLEAALRSVGNEDEDSLAMAGLTDAIRQVVRGGGERGLAPTELRERLLGRGFKLSKYSQPLAMIHVILKRLERNGEVLQIGAEPRRYWWTLNSSPPELLRSSPQADAEIPKPDGAENPEAAKLRRLV